MSEKSWLLSVVARPALSWLCALLAFALVCASVSRLFPQRVEGVGLKEDRFWQQRNQIDIVFIGSSRVFHGISPKVFDRTLQAAGRPWHSFNAGADGMNYEEGFALVRRLLAMHPPRLKYIVCEFQSDPGAEKPIRDDSVRERDVYWRDWDSVVAALYKFALGVSSPLPSNFGDKFSLGRWTYFGPLLWTDFRLWVRNVTHLGRGFSIAQQMFGEPSARSLESKMPREWDGFFAMGRPMTGKILSDYRQSLQALRDHPVTRPPDPVMRSQLSLFAHRMASKNIEVIFLLPPSVVGNPGDEIDAPPGNLILTYDDLKRYPQFYAEENRMDRWHLNARGADLFSQQLATDFLRVLKFAGSLGIPTRAAVCPPERMMIMAPVMRPLRQPIFACLGFALLLASAGPVRSETAVRIDRKLHWCEAHKDDFDIIFVGSSRVFHGLSPRNFDQETRAGGQHWRSFNLAMDKMGMAQSVAIIRELEATGPRRLKYVFFELEPGMATLAAEQHSPAQSEPPLRSSGSGLGPDGDGFFPMNRPMSPAVESFYQQRLSVVKANPAPRPPNAVARAELGQFYEEMAARDIQVIFLVAPSLRAAHGSGSNAPSGSPLFSYDDVVRYAALYDEANRMDAQHLNARGAEIFSRTLAREFLAQAGSTAR